jgi:acetylornithine deacetylase/succinyl-diaminopimelate desuccinylase-like protein
VTLPSSSAEGLTGLEQELLAGIDDREEDLFQRLETLVRFRTPNPPGGNESAAQDWIESQLRELDLEVDR